MFDITVPGMLRGRQTRSLSVSEVEWLQEYRLARTLSVRALLLLMRPPFTAETLSKALQGLPIYDLYAAWLTNWIDEHGHTPKTRRPTPIISRGRGN